MRTSVAVLCFVALQLQLGYASELAVTIDVSYTKPAGFSMDPPNYRAGSSITLTCRVEGVTDGLTYSWSSTCTHNCFVRDMTTQNVTRHGLRSVDSGTHMCNVTDALGRKGTATIVMNVVGAGIYASSAREALMNNSLIKAASNQHLEFMCMSGSKQGGVGHFIGRDGQDITYKYGDPFYVSIGGTENPSWVQVSSYNTLYAAYQGIYTCRIPDETGNLVDINVGLYCYEFNTVPHVTALERNTSSSFTTLTCTSTGSPPTTVTWTKDGVTLPANETIYSFTQTLVDRATSTYNNTLTIDASFIDVIGNYSCRVSNSIGTSSVQETEIKAVEIHGHEETIFVGLVGEIYCSTHLNVTQIEWFHVRVNDSLREKSYGSQNLVLTINASSIVLNGAMFICKVTDVEGKQYEESVSIRIKELENIVTIHAAQSTMFAGGSYTLNCTVMSDLRSVVKWIGLDSNPVDNTSSITVDAPVYDGIKTYLLLRFLALRTSQAGEYSCQSIVSSPLSVGNATKSVVVTVPSPRVRIINTPSTGVHTTTRLNLTCITVLNTRVDTPVTVTHTWRGPSGSIARYSSRPTVSSVTRAGQVYWSSIFFSSGMRTSDSGTYYCTSSTSSASSYIATSGSVAVSTSVAVALKVVIDISYTPPEEGYQPPYYRAASSGVTLTCRAVGATGRIRYRWTSTCSSCFVPSSNYYSYSGYSRSKTFLVSRDAGTHTCSAYDTSQGGSGSASTVMNIAGAGVYNIQSSTSLPNNSIISTNTYSFWISVRRFDFYCCSNSTSGYIGTFIGLNGNPYSDRFSVQRFSSSDSYTGCIRITWYGSSTQSTSEEGIYTCRMPDSAGRNIDVHVGIYRQDYNPAPRVTSLQRTSSTTNLTLACTSTNSPATNVTWMKDGNTLDIDGVKYKTYQTVTNRRTSTYQNTLVVGDDIENITGNYTCRVTNRLGSSSRVLTVSEEPENTVTIHAAQSAVFAGASYTLNCTVMSEFRSLVKWTGPDGNPVHNTSSITVNAPVYDGVKTYVLVLRFHALRTSQAGTYTCHSVVGLPELVRTASKDVVVKVPSPRVHIIRAPSTGIYTTTRLNLTCITVMSAEVDTPVTVTHSWRGPSGNISRYSSRLSVSNVTRVRQEYWSSLFFSSGIRASDAGTYSCTSNTHSTSSYIVTSGSVAASTTITVALKVVIDISYTPPEEGYQPPYYRAASHVTLTCRAVGATGQIRYRWTSTCSSCSVPGGYYYSNSGSSRNLILRSRNAGTHRCFAYDSVRGISGNASTVMNIIGAGIYVTNSQLSYRSSSLPNNSIITSSVVPDVSSHQIAFYCCSNSTTSGSTGTFIGLSGNSYSGIINVERYGSSHSYAGCIYLYLPGRYYFQNYSSFNDEGIYTCRMPDSAGRNVDVSVGIYRDDYTAAPNVTSLQSTSSTTNLTLTCTSINSPATNVTWMKDGETLDIDREKYKTYQTVTNRRTSTYQNTLVVDDDIKNIPGNYTCRVTNRFGSSSRDLTISRDAGVYVTTSYVPHSGSSLPNNSIITTYTGSVGYHSTYRRLAFYCCSNSTSGYFSSFVGPDGYSYSGRISIERFSSPSSYAGCMYLYLDKLRNSFSQNVLSTGEQGIYTCRMPDSAGRIIELSVGIYRDDYYTAAPRVTSLYRTSSTTNLTLTCTSTSSPATTVTWMKDDDTLDIDGEKYKTYQTVTNRRSSTYQNSLVVDDDIENITGIYYTCRVTNRFGSSSEYLFVRVLKVVIDISYTPPEEGYQPPYYRAASSVTLTCRAVGARGQIRYRWTSTCSSCFVPSSNYYSYSNSRSKTFLVSRDAGTHTCSAYDSSQGGSGSASTVMNIVGAGIYVTTSQLSYRSSSLHNNSIITTYTGSVSYYSSYTRMAFYCCSNSTSGHTGTFIGLNGNRYSYSGRISFQYYTSSSGNAGCMYISLSKNYRSYSQNYLSSSEEGIYTCRMPDSAGRNIDVSVGIYRHGYTYAPRVTSLHHTSSTTKFTLTCTSTNSPATNVTWMKNGDTLDIDGVKYKTYQTVTNRRTSTYQNTLVVDGVIENITGNYTCQVTNIVGSSSRVLTVSEGVEISSIAMPLTLGDTVSIVCSANLAATTIEWIRDGITVDTVAMDNSSNQSLTLVLDPVSANHHNTQYTCRVTSPYGDGVLEETVNITVQIPQAWATVQISTPPDDSAIVGKEFVMTCTVTAVRELMVIPEVIWTGPNGNLTGTKNITMGYKQASGNMTTRSLTLHSLQSSEGGQYSCMAAVDISGLEAPPQISSSKHLTVISQALIQLKFGRLQHYLQWTNPQDSYRYTNWIEGAVKEALTTAIRERCSCNFQSTSIENGLFSWQTIPTYIVYRTTINGTSDLRTAPQLLNFIEDWIKNEGMFLLGSFHLRVAPDCPLQIQSLYQPECMKDESTSTPTTVSPTITTGTPPVVTTPPPVVTTPPPSDPLEVYFANNTPHVVGNTVTVQVHTNKPASATCRLGQVATMLCSPGSTTVFQNVPSDFYYLRVTATSGSEEKEVTWKVYVPETSAVCSVNLINTGLVVNGSTVSLEFRGMGPTSRFTCRLDSRQFHSCSSPLVYSGLTPGEHRIRVLPQGCQQTQGQTFRFTM